MNRTKVSEKDSFMSARALTAELKKRWNALTDDERDEYEDMALIQATA